MLFDNIKKAVNYTLYLIIIIVALTWIDHYIIFLSSLKNVESADNYALFPILISVFAALILIVIYLYENSMTKGLNISAYIARSSVQSRKKLDHVLENIRESIMIVNMDGKIIYFNEQARRIFNLPRKSRDWFYEDYFPINVYKTERIKNCLLAGRIWEDQSQIRFDDCEKTFMHRIYPVSIKQEPEEVIIISTDISELVEASKNAESANLSKSQFLANMTHELRTPMIGVLGSTDLLSHTTLNPEQYSHLDTIRECGEQLLNIINDILDLSKIDLGIDTLHPVPGNLTQIMEKTMHMLDSSLQAKGLQMTAYIDPSLPLKILLDEQKFRQILVNLLANAIKFTSAGYIHIKAMQETDANLNEWLLISVADTGIGIPENKLDSIFCRFTQADGSSHREYGGTGLGLYICERLVRLMSGRIWVQSQVGIGTTFTFRIPLIIPDASSEEVQQQPAPCNTPEESLINGFQPIRILLVEDNELNQKLILQMLISYGFEVEFVNNGLECLQVLEQHDFNLILMDMQMPVMDGYEAARIIRANASWDHIPVIAITANAMSGDREKCLDCGCASYLAKPFKAAELVQEIKFQLKTSFVQKNNRDLFSNQLIADLIPEFLSMLEELLEELELSIQRRDLKKIRNQSHAIKGTAGMYGFNRLSEIAALIEQACREEQFHRIPPLFSQISKSYQQICTQVQSDVV